MEPLDNIQHITVMACSLDTIYNQSRITGKLSASNLYLLEAINKFLGGCNTSLTERQKRSLFTLYDNILTSSKEICNVSLQNLQTVQSKPKFVQAEVGDANEVPVQTNLIYYWQEPLGITNEDIINMIMTGTYLYTKPSDVKSIFVGGKDIEYTNIGPIVFSILALENETYKIYDINNLDITSSFGSYYDSLLKVRTFISNNIYSYGTMNFKIKKI